MNGTVGIGDWVRELPADHFQPCYCCLCRPPSGSRPVLQCRNIVYRHGSTFLELTDGETYPAEELEQVAAPDQGQESRRSRRSRSNLALFLRNASH